MTNPDIAPLTRSHEGALKVTSFRTAKGSTYTYGEDGRTTRFKEAAINRGEQPQHLPQDITVFVHLTPEARQKYLDALHAHNDDPTKRKKVYIVEPLSDGRPHIVRRIDDAYHPGNLYLAIMQNGEVLGVTKASTEPEIGANVFDTRHFQEGESWYTERHLGNQVVSIDYAE